MLMRPQVESDDAEPHVHLHWLTLAFQIMLFTTWEIPLTQHHLFQIKVTPIVFQGNNFELSILIIFNALIFSNFKILSVLLIVLT